MIARPYACIGPNQCGSWDSILAHFLTAHGSVAWKRMVFALTTNRTSRLASRLIKESSQLGMILPHYPRRPLYLKVISTEEFGGTLQLSSSPNTHPDPDWPYANEGGSRTVLCPPSFIGFIWEFPRRASSHPAIICATTDSPISISTSNDMHLYWIICIFSALTAIAYLPLANIKLETLRPIVHLPWISRQELTIDPEHWGIEADFLWSRYLKVLLEYQDVPVDSDLAV